MFPYIRGRLEYWMYGRKIVQQLTPPRFVFFTEIFLHDNPIFKVFEVSFVYLFQIHSKVFIRLYKHFCFTHLFIIHPS